MAVLALVSLTMQSCKQPDELVSQPPVAGTETGHSDTQALAAFLSSELGVASTEIVYEDTVHAFVVEKDMLVSEADVRVRMKAGIGAKTTQRRAKWLLSDAVVGSLGISIDANFPAEWKQAINEVALTWNHNNPKVKFYITNDNPKVRLKTYFSGKNDLSYIVKAPLPAQDGNVGGEVLVNYNYCYYGPQIPLSMKKAAIVHALGHVLGLTHTNPDGSYDNMHIPGTPTVDNASVMKSTFAAWTSLSWGDWMAAKYLYPSNTGWSTMGTGYDLAAGGGSDATLWKLGTIPLPKGMMVHKFNWSTKNWDTVPCQGAARIAVNPITERPWIVDSTGDIFEMLANGTWKKYPGKAGDIGVGANGQVWIIGTTFIDGGKSGWSIHKLENGKWVQKPGGGVYIAVDADGNAWVANSKGEIYRYNGTKFVQLPGLASDIAISADGYVYITGRSDALGGKIYRWQGNSWTQLGGFGYNITALEAPYGPLVSINGTIQSWFNFNM
ncbi:tectonin domain-containing protein [Dyadobacter fermentans]|uniref:Peptidase metallopeptidase domain-containing protein n=1 Tax=Dyadobacter fermentans (strain ATCC 700827 / DSM 18053 / CIP 107007 / KCTC 52180 / NS114) TaxID=471854 RepID=C6VZU7_DYAFD|nr:tectonin domain-containing protein [Dyadobacter fermentans]ACT93575.1 hypothetical protein Dfer_2356 [Dyadobacter fermentans DSM 18053]